MDKILRWPYAPIRDRPITERVWVAFKPQGIKLKKENNYMLYEKLCGLMPSDIKMF